MKCVQQKLQPSIVLPCSCLELFSKASALDLFKEPKHLAHECRNGLCLFAYRTQGIEPRSQVTTGVSADVHVNARWGNVEACSPERQPHRYSLTAAPIFLLQVSES